MKNFIFRLFSQKEEIFEKVIFLRRGRSICEICRFE